MNLFEFAQIARRDFIEAGPDRHFACPSGHATGQSGAALCVMGHAIAGTGRRLGVDFPSFEFEQAWHHVHREYPTDTNGRGFAACVAAYDEVLLALAAEYAPALTREEVLA